jgi:hypothetical protein
MHMTDEPTIEQLLEPSAALSRALDFMETDLDADAYNAISVWVARAIREIREDLARAQAIDPEALEGLPSARMKIEGCKLWLRIFEEIQGAITRYGSGWQA